MSDEQEDLSKQSIAEAVDKEVKEIAKAYTELGSKITNRKNEWSVKQITDLMVELINLARTLAEDLDKVCAERDEYADALMQIKGKLEQGQITMAMHDKKDKEIH